MPSIYCSNKKMREWYSGHDEFCCEDFYKCRYAVKIGEQHYCGYCPPRVTLRDTIRTEAGCLFCKHSVLKLSSAKCSECLSKPSRVNYEREAD